MQNLQELIDNNELIFVPTTTSVNGMCITLIEEHQGSTERRTQTVYIQTETGIALKLDIDTNTRINARNLTLSLGPSMNKSSRCDYLLFYGNKTYCIEMKKKKTQNSIRDLDRVTRQLLTTRTQHLPALQNDFIDQELTCNTNYFHTDNIILCYIHEPTDMENAGSDRPQRIDNMLIRFILNTQTIQDELDQSEIKYISTNTGIISITDLENT